MVVVSSLVSIEMERLKDGNVEIYSYVLAMTFIVSVKPN